MAHLDAPTAECLVFTYKEGLLSAIAHDLEIRVERFELDVDEGTLAIRAHFDPASLRVVAAMHEGAPQPAALSEADKQKIEHNIAEDVLHVREYPAISFASTMVAAEAGGFRIEGELTLHGATRPLSFAARPGREDRLVAEVSIHQPSFGIKPYTAMLGALKIKPNVTVRCSVPRACLPTR
jgi:hypothetical protein